MGIIIAGFATCGKSILGKKYNNIKNCDIFNNGLENNSFDIITALDVIEHIENENQFLNEIKRLLCNFHRGGVKSC